MKMLLQLQHSCRLLVKLSLHQYSHKYSTQESTAVHHMLAWWCKRVVRMTTKVYGEEDHPKTL